MREQSAVYKVPHSVMHSNFQHSTGRSLRITNPVTLPDAHSVKKSSRTSPSAGSCKEEPEKLQGANVHGRAIFKIE